MITLVIYGLLAVALAASAGYAFIVFTTTSRQLIQLQENQAQISAAATAMQANLLSFGPPDSTGNMPGYIYPPIGTTIAGTYTQLPAMLGGISAAPWGQPYEYCPVSPTTTTTLTPTTNLNILNSTGGTDYTVKVNSGHVVTTPATVIANRTGYFGFIVSTLGPGQTMPACSSIKVNSGAAGLTVPGGIVRGITSGLPLMQGAVSASDRLEIYVDSTALANGSGVDASNPMNSLDKALALWRILQPRLTEIYLKPSGTTYSTTDTLDGEAPPNGLAADGSKGRYDALGENTSLVIETDPSQVSNDDSNTNLASTVAFQNPLVLTSATTFQNVIISIKSTGGQIITAYKPLIVRTATIKTTTGVGAINLYNTSFTSTDGNFGNSTTIYDTIYAMNSNVEFLNYTNTTSYPGSIHANGSTVSFDNFASSQQVYQAGDISLSASTLNVGNYLADGGITNPTPFIQINSLSAYASIINVAPSAELRFPQLLSGPGNLLANGSRLNVSLGGIINNYVSQSFDAITATGSTIGIDGAYYLYNQGSAAGIIGSRQATLVGSGQLYTNTIGSTSCVDILNSGPNYSPGPVYAPVHIPASSSFAASDEPGFTDIQYGLPPLLAYKASDTVNNPAVAGHLQQSVSPQSWPMLNDPYITLPLQAAYTAGPSYLGPTSLENAVRGIANQDFISGLNINFLGTCGLGSQ